MKVGRFLDTERYDKKGRLFIIKGFRIGHFRFGTSEIALSQEELKAIGLIDTEAEKRE